MNDSEEPLVDRRPHCLFCHEEEEDSSNRLLRRRRRRKSQKKKKSPPLVLEISDLSDDIIAEVFKFLGRGHFLFVAGTSRQFHRVYGTMRGNENNSTVATTMTSAVESISRLQWARANGCPWNWRTCSCAASNGHCRGVQVSRTGTFSLCGGNLTTIPSCPRNDARE